MVSSGRKYVLEKFKKKNFKNVEFKIELELEIEGLLEVVDGTREEQIEKISEEWKTWKGWDEMARLEILMHMNHMMVRLSCTQ